MGGIEFVGLNRFWVTKCTFVFTGPCFPRPHIERTVFCLCFVLLGGAFQESTVLESILREITLFGNVSWFVWLNYP